MTIGVRDSQRTYIANMNPHAVKEGNNVIHGSRYHKFPVIEPKTYPEVIHQYGEANHHGCDTPWATELVSGGYAGEHRSQSRHGIPTFGVGPRAGQFCGPRPWWLRKQRLTAVCRRFAVAAHCWCRHMTATCWSS